MKFLAKLILTGALTVLPLLATGYVAFWFFNFIEESFGLPVKWAIGEDRYVDGMGLTFAAVVFLLTGILMRTPPFRRLFGGAERLLLSIPVVKSVYGALRDFFSLFARRKGEKSLQVVAVDIPGTGMRLLGFVTRTEFTDVPNGVGGEGDVAVYLPMSYQIGGYTVFLPRKRVRQVDMSREAVPADARAQVEVACEARTGKARLKPLACTVRPRSATRSLNRLVYESELRTREAGGERELRRVNRD